MSKLQASSVRTAIRDVLYQSSLEGQKAGSGFKKRNFVETIELQIGLKNYDTNRDKRVRIGESGDGRWTTFLWKAKAVLPPKLIP